MYGWKGKIGLIIPSRNTTMEPEFIKMAPEGVSIHATRVILKEVCPEYLKQMEQEIYNAAKIIADVDPNIIIVGCTSGSFIGGVGYDKKLSEEITKITGAKAITTSSAVIEALKLLNINKIAIATPYTDEVNEKEKEFIEGYGIHVTCITGLGYSKPIEVFPLTSKPVSGIGLLDPAIAYKLGLSVNTSDADGIFISCTNFRTIEIIDALERNIGKPVITSNQATMVIALKKMGINEKKVGFGSIFEKAFP